MGLDMYLTAEKYLSKFSPEEEKKIQAINELFGITESNDDYRAESVIFNVAYWRKANAIHGWFVQNVQEGKDECQKSYVTRDQLKELIRVCKCVQEDHKKAKKLLPPTSGFFFGSTDVDGYYFEDLEITVKQLEKVLNDPALECADLYYTSSW